MMELVKKEKPAFFPGLAEFEKGVAADEPAWLQAARTAARLRFFELGLPASDDEDWRFTNLAPLVEVPFRPAPDGLNGLKRGEVDKLRFADLRCSRLVFINGCYSELLSSPSQLPAGVKAGSLAAALREDPGSVEPWLGQFAKFQDHSFNALNTALMKDGAFVYVPPGQVVEQTIHLLFLSTKCSEAVASFPRNLIVADGNSQVSIVESYVGIGEGVYFSGPVTEIIARDGAVVEHSKLQHESPQAFHVGTLQYQQERSSSLISNTITLGGGLVRNNLTAVLDGDGAECTLNGLYLVSGRQHVDNHTRLEHAAPHCVSRELYKGILDDQSRAVFHGRILVRRGAQKTDSKQTNNNLLLSDEALVNTKPQLEIYADDVKCTHGATIGQLDRDAVFYLRSRGIGEKAARSLLIYAFASEIIRRCKAGSLKDQLDEFLLRWLPAGESLKEAVAR